MNYQQKNKINIVRTDDNPLVSVIVPSDKLEVYFMNAVNLIRNQTYKNHEIIIIDNSRDKEFYGRLEELKNNNPDLVILSRKGLTISELKNDGISIAKGKYIICLNPEDKIDKTYIEKAIEILESKINNGVGFVTSWSCRLDEKDVINKFTKIENAQLLVENYIHSGSIFKKTLWEEVGKYREKLDGGYEDWDLWLSFVEKGYKCAIIKSILFFGHADNGQNGKKDLDKYSCIINFHINLFKDHSLEIVRLLTLKNEEKTKAIEEKRHQIYEIQKQLSKALKQARDLDEGLSQIKASRITGPSLKLRDAVKNARNKYYLLRHRSFEMIKMLIPMPIKSYTKKLINRRLQSRISFVTNEKWQLGLPLVTIVTPYYNQGGTVGDTIKSVLAQTFSNFEYIIVNDGSSKDNTDILNKIKKDKRVNIINLPINIGKGSPAAARNYAIKIAKGKYIVCLDSDDKLDPTYIEKCVTVMETQPSLGLVNSIAKTFGASDEILPYCDYVPLNLMSNNMVKTSAMFKKEAWEKVGGYKAGIGYEDWEFWINLAENGFFGYLIHEPLFHYMVAVQSRYVDDKEKHNSNMDTIKKIHPNYKNIVAKKWKRYLKYPSVTDKESAYVNLCDTKLFRSGPVDNGKNVLIAIPWMTFGGAETLIINFCQELKEKYNIHFITGQKSDNEWEQRFKNISSNIFHLPNLFDDYYQRLGFIQNYIKTREIDILHIIHTDFTLDMVEEIKRMNPKIKIIVTMFNDRVDRYFLPAVGLNRFIDAYSSDNQATSKHFIAKLPEGTIVKTIPNGIDCYGMFNPALYDRFNERNSLGIKENEIAVFFVGRLSAEKNPDVFLRVAKEIINTKKHQAVKFFIIGDGVMRSNIESEVISIGNNRVVYLGYKNDVARCLGSADIFVLPSSIEGFPLSILEAMAMKLAVIASGVGAIPDIIDSEVDGSVVRPGSANDIIKVINKLDDNREALEIIKRAARLKILGSYSNLKLRDNYFVFYEEVLK